MRRPRPDGSLRSGERTIGRTPAACRSPRREPRCRRLLDAHREVGDRVAHAVRHELRHHDRDARRRCRAERRRARLATKRRAGADRVGRVREVALRRSWVDRENVGEAGGLDQAAYERRTVRARAPICVFAATRSSSAMPLLSMKSSAREVEVDAFGRRLRSPGRSTPRNESTLDMSISPVSRMTGTPVGVGGDLARCRSTRPTSSSSSI